MPLVLLYCHRFISARKSEASTTKLLLEYTDCANERATTWTVITITHKSWFTR